MITVLLWLQWCCSCSRTGQSVQQNLSKFERNENSCFYFVPCQPLAGADKLIARPQIKTEYQSGISEDMDNNSLPSKANIELRKSIKSEYNIDSPIIVIEDSPRKSHDKSPRLMKAHVKQEISTESIKTETIQIKCEYNEFNSHASTTEKPVSIKTEDKYVQRSVKPLKLKMPKIKFKMESNDANMIYQHSNNTFYNEFQHFGPMTNKRRDKYRCIQCYFCHRFFQKESDMIRHSKAVHTGFSCIYCRMKFPKKCFLLDHMMVAHNLPLKNNESYCQPERFKWQRQTRSQTRKSIKKIKEECTSNIKTEPALGDAKNEFKPTNIKVEQIKTEPSISERIKTEPSF